MMSTSTPNRKPVAKSSKPSLIIVLRLSTKSLTQLSTSTSRTLRLIDIPSNDNDNAVDKADTPVSSSMDENTNPSKPSSPKTGTKRDAETAELDGASKQAKKPGPKKKTRTTDGPINGSTNQSRPNGTTAAPSGGRNGPRGLAGAVNAGLRALDRTGKPCRRWDKKGFSVKSFTGVGWALGSWSSPLRESSTFSGDVKSDSSETGDIKPTLESSIVHSDSSRSGEVPLRRTNGIESSPMPISA